MPSLCPYKNIFGKVGEGAHKYRLFGFAIVDTVLTLVGAFLIAHYTKQDPILIFLILILLSILVHRAFCVETTLTKLALGSQK
jgi:uncharacterized membrane protein